MERGTLILKRQMVSSKFSLVYPSNIPLNYITDAEGRKFAEHNVHKNVYIRVTDKQIKSNKVETN